MTIEEKAKAYDNALAHAKLLLKTIGNATLGNLVLKNEFEIMFPVLKENESERIIKALIQFVNQCSEELLHPENARQMLAWLEEQGEQNLVNTDLDELVIQLEETIGTSPHSRETIKDFFQKAVQKYMNCLRIANGEIGRLFDENYSLKEKQGEQNLVVVPKFRVGDVVRHIPNEVNMSQVEYRITRIDDKFYYSELKDGVEFILFGFPVEDAWELVEQKYAWSEEDEKILNGIIEAGEHHCQLNIEETNWLKSLRPQKQQEWNKQDIEMIDWLIRCCEKEHKDLCNDRYGHQEIVSDLKRDCRKKWDWLESLKNKVVPQNTWKPSDEQMKALNIALKAGIQLGTWEEKALRELKEQLKKL